jgi:hypothetical protein
LKPGCRLPASKTGPRPGFREKPSADLDSLPAILNYRREKRLFYALDRYTSQKVSSNKKQTCQEWNFDLHDASPTFPLDKSLWQGVCQTPLLLEEQINAEIYEISVFGNLVSMICDERKCRAIGTSRNSGLV